MRVIKAILIIYLFLSFCFSGELQAKNLSAHNLDAGSSGYVEINKVKIYYEVHGEGTPLLYLHGGLSSSLDFSNYIPELSKHFKVISFDRRGHGRSGDNGNIFSYDSMAENTKLFLDKMGIEKALVIGWSDGGVVGYHLASKYPSKVIKLISVGANSLVGGLKKSSIEWIKKHVTAEEISKVLPSIENKYKQLNPQPDNFKKFINKTRKMWLRDPYISKENLQKINLPVMLVAGDRDEVRLEHMLEIYSLLKQPQLSILPNTTHFMFHEYNATVAKILIDFLK